MRKWSSKSFTVTLEPTTALVREADAASSADLLSSSVEGVPEISELNPALGHFLDNLEEEEEEGAEYF